MALVTLAEVKTYLGISANTYDTFLTEQINLVSDAVEGYCGRVFSSASYVQDFYKDDFETSTTELYLFHYPIVSVASVKPFTLVSGSKSYGTTITAYRSNKPKGILVYPDGFLYDEDGIEVTYTAGFATIPTVLKHVCYGVIEGRYTKKLSGINLNFGSDVQRISIPGAISIDFDYSLTANERSNAYGIILGNYLNMLDPYRSHRVLTGEGKITYVT